MKFTTKIIYKIDYHFIDNDRKDIDSYLELIINRTLLSKYHDLWVEKLKENNSKNFEIIPYINITDNNDLEITLNITTISYDYNYIMTEAKELLNDTAKSLINKYNLFINFNKQLLELYCELKIKEISL